MQDSDWLFSNRALKRQELGDYVFEEEYDLALAIIKGSENRGQQGNYYVEHLLFNQVELFSNQNIVSLCFD